MVGIGVQLNQVPEFGQNFTGPKPGTSSRRQQLGSTSAEFIRRDMNVAPTLEVRPGYPFTVMVTQDVIFPGPYTEARQE